MLLPLISELLSRVARHPSLELALDSLRHAAPSASLSGLTDTAKSLVAALTSIQLRRPTILLVESNPRAESLAEPLRFFHRALSGSQSASAQSSAVSVLPAHDVLPWESLSPHPDISEARAVALWRYTTGEASLLIVPIAGAALRLRDAAHYERLAFPLARDQEVSLDALLAHLAEVGYARHELVEMPGQFSLRGGIVDAFSPEARRPVRLELLGDTVESIREFDPDTQRSTGPLERTVLLPLTDSPRTPALVERIYAGFADPTLTERELSHADTLPGWEFLAAQLDPPSHSLFSLRESPLILLDEPSAISAALAQLTARLNQSFTEASATRGAAPPSTFYLLGDEWSSTLARTQRLSLEHLFLESGDTSPQEVRARHGVPQPSSLLVDSGALSLPSVPTQRFHGNIPSFMAELRGRIAASEHVLLAAANTGELERLADLAREFEIPFRLGERDAGATMARLADDSAVTSSAITLVKAPIAEGVTFPDVRLTIHGISDLFETLATASPARRRAKTAAFTSDLGDLKPGDYVVHIDHGIGRFDGLRQLSTDGSGPGEFMLLSFAEDARLYVPLARLDLVQKYRSLEGAKPALDRLGGAVWEARKSRVKKSVADMAEKLLALYADRRTAAGHVFSPDSAWQREFEDAFEFEETPDQDTAIADVKRDMERPLPMDRLLVGDVGYGKTEVAMRAAFKAVSDSKQVAVLAPTTVLVFQHFETFRRRFAAFPLRIESLSRFRTPAEQKRVLADLEAGKVDVVIGTHRLLSKDVRFHDLGLLVVDEEQRFGVAHKERLKELRKNVDVLAMSATPIPRTLHMSLVGLRDMSVIETPPKDRLAIQTVVAPFKETLIQRAIEEELQRSGQVYFVHNRVESIFSLAALLQKLVPRARIAVGHGQMGERDLERVMLKFVRHEADILVSTSIIENGLDIPAANTILINRADRFGLSELYQLRGRVGRANQRAYAYLLVPPESSLSAIARRRLAALKEFSDLGAGFRIASLDLELRGAGNLLGGEQHGHVNAVGFELYQQMLERAVAERKGEAPRSELRATINLGLDIRIPAAYIESENVRLRTYKRIADVSVPHECDAVLAELSDRFGPPPPPVTNLLDYALLKAQAERLGVAAIDRKADQIAIRFHDATNVSPEKLVRLVRSQRGLRLDPSGVLWFKPPSPSPSTSPSSSPSSSPSVASSVASPSASSSPPSLIFAIRPLLDALSS